MEEATWGRGSWVLGKAQFLGLNFWLYSVCILSALVGFEALSRLSSKRVDERHQRDQDDEGNREGSVVGYILYVFFQPWS